MKIEIKLHGGIKPLEVYDSDEPRLLALEFAEEHGVSGANVLKLQQTMLVQKLLNRVCEH